MPIQFDPSRWQRVKADSQAWWSGSLNRPLIQMRLAGADPGRAEPLLPPRLRTAMYGFDIPAKEVIDRWDYDLSCIRYLGDAFPAFNPDFGPGVVATFLGADAEVDDKTVWFSPREPRAITDLSFQRDQHHPWVDRLEEILGAALARWQGQVQIGTTDLGGVYDILSTFRPSERLPLDLYDHPETVRCLSRDIHELWWSYFDRFNGLTSPANPGYTCWTPIFSTTPYFMLQCDFAYMIGPEMFAEFVLPELASSCRRLDHAFYHLDGPGQLPHLDALLALDELKGVQWIPGAGANDIDCWPDLYRRIRDAGKYIQVFGTMATFEAIVGQLGESKGIVFIGTEEIGRETEVIGFLERHGVPV